jgi:hypothetical protein
MTDPDLPPITLPAEYVIPAWRNAFLAASDDDAAPVLNRTVAVEWYPEGLRFTSTDSYVLVTSYADGDRFGPIQVDAPDLDESPMGAVVAIAADRLMTDFLKHRAAEVKAYNRYMDAKGPEAPGPIDITFSLGTIDEPNTAQQRLDLGEENQRRLIVSCDTERIALPLYDGEFPNWRASLSSHRPAPRAKVSARADILRRIGQLNSLPFTDDQDWLQLTMANGGALVMVSGVGRVPIEGAFAPRREEAAEEADAA